MDLLSVHEAAVALDVDDSRIRQLLRDGRLLGRRVGGRWLVDGAAVRDRRERGARPGRPMSARNAWGLLAVLAGQVPTGLSDAEKSRLVARLRNLAVHDQLPVVRLRELLEARAETRRYRVHSGMLQAILAHPDVVRAGVSATGDVGADYVAPGRAEVYALPDSVGELEAAFGMVRDHDRGNLVVRIPPADAWPFLTSFTQKGAAPSSVVAADLLDIYEDRANAAAVGLLRPLLAHYPQPGGRRS
ncbi:type IV toxin-antitoxin system AbiEi family antitoxin [Streptomyces sp. NPDC051183]|uniref:type IV toxin-antitoxin system AbiEi family antitoxin n=1 Tax=unclassified Streptomyces TaxID=2593676 RepID=UPI00343978F3